MAIIVVPAATGSAETHDPSDLVRLAKAAYLARFKGESRTHTASDLNVFLTWCQEREVEPMTATRVHLELFLRWMQETRRFKPSTVSRRLSVVTGFYRTAVIDTVLEYSPAEYVRRPTVPPESPTLGLTHLQFEALLTAARTSNNPHDFALVAMLGLLGLRIFEATSLTVTDLREEHGHRVLRVVGKGARVVLVPLPPAVGRAVDRAIADRVSGSILLNTQGRPMDRHAATRRLHHLADAAGVRLPRMHPHMLRHTFVTTSIAAGPSGLTLIDIDAHDDALPADLSTGLLPGIDLADEHIPHSKWRDPGRFRDGRDTLRLLAALRGGPRPWPADPGRQPVTVATPSGGRHLWYQAPALGLSQALSGLAWQVDIKAGWSYGLAPGAALPSGTYEILCGDTARPGHMPGWLADAVIRVSGPRPARSAPAPAVPQHLPGRHASAYLVAVIDRGATRIAAMSDGRQRALSALAYQAGGLLTWSGLPHDQVTDWLADAGTACGLRPALARRIVTRALARGLSEPITPPSARGGTVRAV